MISAIKQIFAEFGPIPTIVGLIFVGTMIYGMFGLKHGDADKGGSKSNSTPPTGGAS